VTAQLYGGLQHNYSSKIRQAGHANEQKKGSFTLAKVSMITPATATATCNSLYLPWQCDINRIYPICVTSPKVAKASTMVTVSHVAVAGIITLNFANVKTA
jgi:hypothetical protein